jgi:MbtH protein
MANPLDNENSTYLVLVNDESQHSLWLSGLDVPAGWSVMHGPADRRDCLDYVEKHWTDMRPASLAAAMRQQR